LIKNFNASARKLIAGVEGSIALAGKNAYRENFAIFPGRRSRPSAQALEIIRHVDASLCRKKSRWDYQKS
jgi:hypothetical protein